MNKDVILFYCLPVLAECKVLFAGEKTRSELFVLPAQSRESLNTNTLPTVDRNCSLDENWSYLECNGKWKAVQNESSAFTFEAGYVQVCFVQF